METLKPHPLERADHDTMERELTKTLTDAAKHINKNYDVEGLRTSLPERMEKSRKRGGDRLTEHLAICFKFERAFEKHVCGTRSAEDPCLPSSSEP